MIAEDEKSKKLREIQERLAEIQGKSGEKKVPVNEPKTSFSDPKPATPKTEEKSIEDKSTVKKAQAVEKNEPVAAKPNSGATQKTGAKKDPSPFIKAITQTPLEKKPETASATNTSVGWSQNKVTAKPGEEKKTMTAAKPAVPKKNGAAVTGKNRSSKILSVISLAITLSVASYIVYSYVLTTNQKEAETVVAEIPEVADDLDNREMPEETNDRGSETEVPAQNTSIKNDNPAQNTAKRVNEKRTERQEKTEEKKQPERNQESPIVKSSVPGGFIISYASNGNSEAAAKNVRILRSKGFTANYYYMRDKDANGPSLYKVYLGPYNSESEAFPDFKKIIKLNEKAFILKMN